MWKKQYVEGIMAENISKLIKDNNPQIQEAMGTPMKMCLKRITPRHIIVKVQKAKKRGKLKSSKDWVWGMGGYVILKEQKFKKGWQWTFQ